MLLCPLEGGRPLLGGFVMLECTNRILAPWWDKRTTSVEAVVVSKGVCPIGYFSVHLI